MPNAYELSSASLPLYLQIKELLLREISLGHWLPGERLPTEATLASELGVAVGTLRKALSQLEAENLVERRQGSGTYLALAAKGKAVYHFFHLELIDSCADLPQAQLLSLDAVQNASAAQALNLPKDTDFWRFRRRRAIRQQTIAVEAIYLPKQRAESLRLEQLPESLYFFYREQLKLWISRVDDTVSVSPLPDWGQDALPDCKASMCGHVERVAYDQHGQRSEFSRTWFDPERACYTARWR